ncbi:MAG: hypothetical protein IT366_10275 [Candidatus Hydrogenedentes bacterium]|nr:hypothetical protein [Candidatus Hydrogenedentota bacterium]
MPMTLGSTTFDPFATSVCERHEEVGGRRERVIEIAGVIAGLPSEGAIHDALDAILNEASSEEYSVALSVRAGRRMFVRRAEFVRNVSAEALTGAFELTLSARDPFEESTALHSVAWPISASGADLDLDTSGNAAANLAIALTAVGTIVSPTFTDGERAIAYNGTLSAGDVLWFDGSAGAATLNGVDVLPYVFGVFPQLDPEGATLTYTDDAASSHAANVAVEYRDRWW